MTVPKPRAAILPFRPGLAVDNVPEQELPMPAFAASAQSSPHATAIDLSGKPKVWFTIGRGRIGKTTLLRWAAETVASRGGEPVYAAADPLNRSLRVFLENVAEPPTSDPEEVARWLRELLAYTMREKTSALVDLGGGDTSLNRLLATMPDLADVMEAEGVAPVAIHVVGNDPHDLVPMAAMEQAGFKPAATAIVLNRMTGRPDEFGPILRHSVFRAAIDRGAIQLWMPYLDPDAARQVNARHIHFMDADRHLGPFARSAVRQWLAAMGTEFSPIASWLP